MAIPAALAVMVAMVEFAFIHGDDMTQRYAVVENGEVINLVISDPDFAATQGWVGVTGSESIGWKYENGAFIAPDPVVPEPAPAPTKEELLAQLAALQAQIMAL